MGAIGGTLGDQIHVQLGVLSYPHPSRWLFGQALWVPPLFAASALALVHGQGLFAGTPPPGEPLPSRPGVIVPAALFVAAYFSTALFGDHPVALTIALVAAWIVRIAPHPTRDRLLAGLGAAVSGPIVEWTLSRGLGAFHYRQPGALGVPLWLPALYLHASLLTRHIWFAFIRSRPAPAVATEAVD